MADPQRFWAMLGSRSSHQGVKWTKEDVEEYQRYYLNAEGVHAVSRSLHNNRCIMVPRRSLRHSADVRGLSRISHYRLRAR